MRPIGSHRTRFDTVRTRYRPQTFTVNPRARSRPRAHAGPRSEGGPAVVLEARHVESTPLAAPQPWPRIDLDLYEIARDGRNAGYVEVVGPVFVALSGPRSDRAVEVRQALSFPDAVYALPLGRAHG